MMKIGNLPLTLLVAAMIALMNAAYSASSGQEMQRTTSQVVEHEGYGVLKAVNTEAGKVLLAHEAIPSLGWPAMTMWFALREPLPKEVMVGDSVRFELEQTQSKEWAITRIERKR